MRSASILVVVLLGVTANTAFADQCEWVTKEQADRAAALFRAGPATVLEYCEPCGDAPPTKTSPKPISIGADGRRAVEVRPVDDGYFSLFINGATFDLAYTFYLRGLNDWNNVAKAVGCEATGVSDSLHLPADGAPAPKSPPKTRSKDGR